MTWWTILCSSLAFWRLRLENKRPYVLNATYGLFQREHVYLVNVEQGDIQICRIVTGNEGSFPMSLFVKGRILSFWQAEANPGYQLVRLMEEGLSQSSWCLFWVQMSQLLKLLQLATASSLARYENPRQLWAMILMFLEWYIHIFPLSECCRSLGVPRCRSLWQFLCERERHQSPGSLGLRLFKGWKQSLGDDLPERYPIKSNQIVHGSCC